MGTAKRKPGRQPAMGWELRSAPRCPDCGSRVRTPRPQKPCPRCHETLPITEFGHHKGRADHHEAYCAVCKREMQRVSSAGIGKLFAISKLAEVQDGWLVGRFVSQGRWVEEGHVASRLGTADVSYRTEDGSTVYRLTLEHVRISDGTSAPEYLLRLDLPHAYAHLTDGTEEPFREGDPIIAVIEHGEIMKLLRIDEQAHTITTLVDEAVHGYLDPDQPQGEEVGFPFKPILRSWSAVRPWMLGLVLAEVAGSSEPTPGCVFFGCGAEALITEDHGYVCPNCTAGVEWSADTVMAVLGKVPDEQVYERMSELETTWLLTQAVEAIAA